MLKKNNSNIEDNWIARIHSQVSTIDFKVFLLTTQPGTSQLHSLPWIKPLLFCQMIKLDSNSQSVTYGAKPKTTANTPTKNMSLHEDNLPNIPSKEVIIKNMFETWRTFVFPSFYVFFFGYDRNPTSPTLSSTPLKNVSPRLELSFSPLSWRLKRTNIVATTCGIKRLKFSSKVGHFFGGWLICSKHKFVSFYLPEHKKSSPLKYPQPFKTQKLKFGVEIGEGRSTLTNKMWENSDGHLNGKGPEVHKFSAFISEFGVLFAHLLLAVWFC